MPVTNSQPFLLTSTTKRGLSSPNVQQHMSSAMIFTVIDSVYEQGIVRNKRLVMFISVKAETHSIDKAISIYTRRACQLKMIVNRPLYFMFSNFLLLVLSVYKTFHISQFISSKHITLRLKYFAFTIGIALLHVQGTRQVIQSSYDFITVGGRSAVDPKFHFVS